MQVTWARPVAIAGGLLLLAACGGRPQPEGPPQFAELMPAPMMQAAAPPPAPVATEPAQPMAAPPPPPPSGPVFGGHLASYTKEADAVRGWNVIVRQQSSIGSLKRHIVPAETPKGHMLRLIAGDFKTADEASRFCSWAKQQGLYCQVMQLPADGSSATPARAPARRPGQRSSAVPPAAPATAAAPVSPTPVAAIPASATPAAGLSIPASGSPIPLRAGARP